VSCAASLHTRTHAHSPTPRATRHNRARSLRSLSLWLSESGSPSAQLILDNERAGCKAGQAQATNNKQTSKHTRRAQPAARSTSTNTSRAHAGTPHTGDTSCDTPHTRPTSSTNTLRATSTQLATAISYQLPAGYTYADERMSNVNVNVECGREAGPSQQHKNYFYYTQTEHTHTHTASGSLTLWHMAHGAN
jgi:Tfp pilus assembly protein PilV